MKKILEFKGLLSFLILHELNTKKLNGEKLAKKIGKRKNSKLTPGTIYPALKKLREQKLIEYEQHGTIKVYGLTKKGNLELKKQYEQFSRYFQGLKKFIVRPKIKKSNNKKLKNKKLNINQPTVKTTSKTKTTKHKINKTNQ